MIPTGRLMSKRDIVRAADEQIASAFRRGALFGFWIAFTPAALVIVWLLGSR